MPSSARLSPARLLPALVLLVAFLAIGFAIQSGPLPGDRFVGDRLTGVALPLMRGVSTLASLPVWSALVLLVAVVLWRQGWRLDATWLVAADVTAELVGLVGKLLFNRPRPDGAAADDIIVTSSFPSGHTLRVVAVLCMLVAVLARHRPAWRTPALVLSLAFMLLVGIARIAVGAHWPSDVLGAFFLGVAWLQVLLLSTPRYGAEPGYQAPRPRQVVPQSQPVRSETQRRP